METLEKLFGSAAKVKIMRLFLFNPNTPYDSGDIESRAQVNHSQVKKEISGLERMGLIKKRLFFKDLKKKKGKVVEVVRVKSSGWVLDDTFCYLTPLQNFLIHLSPMKHQDIIKKISRAGKIKLLIVAGAFIQQPESRVDLLVVGDNLRRGSLESIVRSIESEIGKELRYSYFETPDFQYRLGMCDKLVRDILDFPHEKVVNRIGIQ